MDKKKNDLIEIFSGTSWEAELVKIQLDNVGITAFIKDGYMGTLYPWYTAPGGVGSVKVTINSDDFERARLIVEEYERNK